MPITWVGSEGYYYTSAELRTIRKAAKFMYPFRKDAWKSLAANTGHVPGTGGTRRLLELIDKESWVEAAGAVKRGCEAWGAENRRAEIAAFVRGR